MDAKHIHRGRYRFAGTNEHDRAHEKRKDGGAADEPGEYWEIVLGHWTLGTVGSSRLYCGGKLQVSGMGKYVHRVVPRLLYSVLTLGRQGKAKLLPAKYAYLDFSLQFTTANTLVHKVDVLSCALHRRTLHRKHLTICLLRQFLVSCAGVETGQPGNCWHVHVSFPLVDLGIPGFHNVALFLVVSTSATMHRCTAASQKKLAGGENGLSGRRCPGGYGLLCYLSWHSEHPSFRCDGFDDSQVYQGYHVLAVHRTTHLLRWRLRM